ncbi:MAG: hypothetical protein GY699_13325 [Desulfobacteraceae bacterium]|nr:hypothetical protein [Desulfobacteraceae bacterium]
MTHIDHFVGLFSLSSCSWGIYCFYISIRIERFIVKRYEKETDLLDTVVFKKHTTFIRYIPNFFSPALYSSHLLMCLWGWKFYSKRKTFRDIKNPEYVTHNFSSKEIQRVKRFGISGLIVTLHVIAYYIINSIWPEVFN